MLRTLVLLGSLGFGLLTATLATAQTPTGDQLPGTQPLVLDEPLDVVMVRGINRFAERELAASRERRAARWNRDYSSVEAYLKSVEPQRQRLREMIGAVNEPVDADVVTPLPIAGEAVRVRWSVAEGVTSDGCLLSPAWIDEQGTQRVGDDRVNVVLVPDATQSPESLLDFKTGTSKADLGRRLAECGCRVLVVAPINREDEVSGHPDIRFTNLPHRELIYRCAFELGRHPVGYEVESVSQAKRVFSFFSEEELPTVVVGVGDGGLIAMCAAALDPEFDACYVAGYFDERESVWQQPIDRNVFGLLTEFGDADIASMIAPRPLVIDASPPPLWEGPQPAREGRLSYAAPGAIVDINLNTAQAEFKRARAHYTRLGSENKIQYFADDNGGASYFSESALQFFLFWQGIRELHDPGTPIDADRVVTVPEAFGTVQQKQLVDSLVRHTQMTLHRSDKVREKFWKEADRSSVEKWVETSQKYRDYIHDHMIGRLPLPTAPLNPRSRKVIDEPTHTGWEVVLDVYPGESSVQSPVSSATTEEETLNTGHSTLDSSVIAGGILLLPKDLQPGEQRPVVVCQHGLEGVPMDTITTDETQRAWGAYKGFSTQLVKRGFIVYVPQNPYRGEDEFRVIQRKSNPLGRSLFSYIIEQHRQTLTWLATLPYVDPERIAFYGLSYGGKTAVRVPPLLKRPVSNAQSPGPTTAGDRLNSQLSTLNPQLLNHPEYCLSICSADFNEWIRKNCSAEDRYSYVFTKEYEMFEWNMGHIAGYAELASLMAPRPFMVERGHDDGVAPDEWVAWEFAKVRRHYDKLGIGDRAEIEWFNGPHTINGQGTFRFLHKHLNWPEPEQAN